MATLIDIAQRRTERAAGHPAAEELQSFAAGRLQAERLLGVSSHLLSGCRRCRQILRDSFGVQAATAAAYHVHAPNDLVDRIRTLAELSPAQVRLALTNLGGFSTTIRAAAALEAKSQLDDREAQARLLAAGADFLLHVLERTKDIDGPRALGDEDALLLGRLAFELSTLIGNGSPDDSATSIIERAWGLVQPSEVFPLPRALLLSAYALVDRACTATSASQKHWTRPPAAGPMEALVEAQRMFALAPSTVEHAMSTFALAGLALESATLEQQSGLFVELARSLDQQATRLGECGEHHLARVAAEYLLAVEIRSERWSEALSLTEELIIASEDEGDMPAAFRLQREAARVLDALGQHTAAMARMRVAKDGFLLNGYALESAFSAIELAELELDSGATTCRSLANDLLPVFGALEDREAVAVLLVLRDAALDGSLSIDQLAECRRILFELTSA